MSQLSANKKILVVDDELDICNFLKTYFNSKGYDTRSALSGEEALQIVDEWTPTIILLDIRMPGMSGVDVLKIVREKHPTIGIIMVTAFADIEIGRSTLKLGASDFIHKPIDLEYLETSVQAKILSIMASR